MRLLFHFSIPLDRSGSSAAVLFLPARVIFKHPGHTNQKGGCAMQELHRGKDVYKRQEHRLVRHGVLECVSGVNERAKRNHVFSQPQLQRLI